MASNPQSPDLPPPKTSRPMLWSAVGIVVGIVVGGIVVGVIEIPGYFIHPPPPNFDVSDRAAVKAHIAAAPTSAMLVVLLAWTLGPLAGSFVAASIASRKFIVHGMTIGLIFALLDLVNLVQYHHPVWLWAGGIVAPLAMGYAGALLAKRLVGGRPSGPQTYDMRREKNMAC
jgi:hypothetical protein